jgi:PAS domain S-box-containing protein
LKPFKEEELHAAIQVALQRRDSEHRMEEERHWLTGVMAAVGDGVIATDPRGRIRCMSRVAEEMTGWTQEEAAGLALNDVLRTVGEWSATAGARKPGQTEELLLTNRRGETIPIEATAADAKNAQGHTVGYVWAFRDIRARKHAERALTERGRHYRTLIENSSDVILVLDHDGVVYYSSPSIERVLGYHPIEVLGESALGIVHEDDVSRVVRTLTGANGQPSSVVRFRARHGDGSWRILEAVAGARYSVTGTARVVVSARDITSRMDAEAKLQEELEVSTTLADLGKALISLLDSPALLDGLCRLTAKALQCEQSRIWLWRAHDDAYELVACHGHTPDEQESLRSIRVPADLVRRLLNRFASEDVVVIMPGDEPVLPPLLQAGIGEVTLSVYMALRRGDEVVGVQSATSRVRQGPLSPAQRRIAAGMAQLGSLALERARLAEDLKRATQFKSDMMAALSHEIRSPLGTCVGLAEVLADGHCGELGTEARSRLLEMRRRLLEISDLIYSILDIGRLERGRMALALGPVQVEELLREIVSELSDYPRADRVTLSARVEGEIPVLETDEMKLKVLLKNLVTNALKFTRVGSVEIVARRVQGQLELAVSDTGRGLAPEERELIFEPFRQIDGDAGSRKGVGLGLYISRQIASMLGGNISLESEVNRGSTFRVRIPFRELG